jgi:enoyl-CoA hydratase/carnithine racemase
VLCQLLRVNERLPLGGGLMAESFAYSMLLAGPEFAAWNRSRTTPPYRPSPEPVVVEEEDGTVVISLNRPEVRNAYDSALRDALVDVLRGLAARPQPVAVVIRGNGPSFCSGGDLGQFGTTPDPVTAHAARTARSPGLLLHQLGATARVHGMCVGAGIELPAFCRTVVAAAEATFRLPEVGMGLIPGAGGTASILARIGRHRTAFMALTGRAVTAPVARAWGLIDEVE